MAGLKKKSNSKYERFKATGRCMRCWKLNDRLPKLMCTGCAKHQMDYQRRRSQVKRENSLCIACGKRAPKLGGRCARCIEYNRVRLAKRYAREREARLSKKNKSPLQAPRPDGPIVNGLLGVNLDDDCYARYSALRKQKELERSRGK